MESHADGTPSTLNFEISTQVFSGPLELLIELVEKRKLLINDISLAAVTDEYMATVSKMQELSLPNTVQFVQLAATLLLIKSKSLLPILEVSSEEEERMDDLEIRLKRYALYRDISFTVQEQFGVQMAHERNYLPDKTPLFVTDSYTTITALHSAIGEVLLNLPREEVKPAVKVRTVVSLEEMIATLLTRIETTFTMRFHELVPRHKEKVQVIVGFLAVLESVKQGGVLAEQEEQFADFTILKPNPTTPQY